LFSLLSSHFSLLCCSFFARRDAALIRRARLGPHPLPAIRGSRLGLFGNARPRVAPSAGQIRAAGVSSARGAKGGKDMTAKRTGYRLESLYPEKCVDLQELFAARGNGWQTILKAIPELKKLGATFKECQRPLDCPRKPWKEICETAGIPFNECNGSNPALLVLARLAKQRRRDKERPERTPSVPSA
jgi:hypothetical protein